MTPDSQIFPLIAEVSRLGQAVKQAGGRPVLVGGWVRDCLLGHPHSKDYDLEVFGLSPEALQKVLQRFGPVHEVGRHFGVLKLTTAEAEYDVSIPRRESKIGKGHKGFLIDSDPGLSFAEAASRRDFTLNSMGYALLEGEFLDPYGGSADLERRILRHVGPAFGEDPLRVLRALQFAGRFGLDIAEDTLAICRQQDLHELPRERLWGELKKLLLLSPRPSAGLQFAAPLGVLPYFPELEALHAAGYAPHDPWQVTLRALDAAASRKTGVEDADLVMLLAALCHRLGAAGKPVGEPAAGSLGVHPLAAAAEAPTRTLLERFTNERSLADTVVVMIREAPRVDEAGRITDGDLRRLSLRVALPALIRLAGALHAGDTGVEGPYSAGSEMTARARALGILDKPPQPLLKGRHLLDAGMKPGRAMGKLLKEAFEQQLDGTLRTEEQALCWMGDVLRERPHLLDEPS